MARTKYGKYILKDTKGKSSSQKTAAITPVVLEGLPDWGGIQHRMKWSFVSQPTVAEDESHSHDFDEFLIFLSSNPANEYDFGAEVELMLGSEKEKQTINTPTVVCIPKGLVHGPLNFKTITKPILFCHIYLTPEYVKKLAS